MGWGKNRGFEGEGEGGKGEGGKGEEGKGKNEGKRKWVGNFSVVD